jgi:hypothetical protein
MLKLTRANATFAKIHNSYVVYVKVATDSSQKNMEFKVFRVGLKRL